MILPLSAMMLATAWAHIRSAVLGVLPPPMVYAYRDVWQPAYAELNRWDAAA